MSYWGELVTGSEIGVRGASGCQRTWELIELSEYCDSAKLQYCTGSPFCVLWKCSIGTAKIIVVVFAAVWAVLALGGLFPIYYNAR